MLFAFKMSNICYGDFVVGIKKIVIFKICRNKYVCSLSNSMLQQKTPGTSTYCYLTER